MRIKGAVQELECRGKEEEIGKTPGMYIHVSWQGHRYSLRSIVIDKSDYEKDLILCTLRNWLLEIRRRGLLSLVH
jgi:hypothetical protein